MKKVIEILRREIEYFENDKKMNKDEWEDAYLIREGMIKGLNHAINKIKQYYKLDFKEI